MKLDLIPSSVLRLGDAPMLLLLDASDACGISVRLLRVGSAYFGFVDDRADLLQRIRMGFAPQFVTVRDAVSTLVGDTRVVVHGLAADEIQRGGANGKVATTLASHDPFGVGAAVLVEVTPLSITEQVLSDESHGALPRT